MGKNKQAAAKNEPEELLLPIREDEDVPDSVAVEDLVPEGKLVCVLTGDFKTASPQEETLQSFVEQLHREYGIALEDMERDVRLPCYSEDPRTGRVKSRNRTISRTVYESGKSREPRNVIRVAIVAKPGTKPDRKAIEGLEEVLGSLSDDRLEVFGIWTNGADLAFRMRTFEPRTDQPVYTELTDFPAPHETLADLDSGTRRPLRIAAGDSLLRAFKCCHGYIHGNHSTSPDKAFWQILYLIFYKIFDEDQSRRKFFVGATEANTPKGRDEVAKRAGQLFEKVRNDVYKDVFDGSEGIELNAPGTAHVAGEIGRYSLLNTETGAKGMVYEAITSHTQEFEGLTRDYTKGCLSGS